ncbi:replicative DNA helicase [Pedobacter sp. Du54]|uniref:replicative DNA helicase n=1 Tax=Pedobacter anseongensis TaxID=3133439 RepID=UPI0030AC0600
MENETKTLTAKRTNLNTMGKIPPQAIDFEEAILGALMLEKDAMVNIASLLKPDAFYQESNKKIFEAIQRLYNRSHPIDIMTVTAEMRQLGTLELVGGPFYITNLTNRVASAANIEYHCFVLQQKFLQRELIKICSEGITNAYDDTTDIFDLYDYLGSQLLLNGNSAMGKTASIIGDIISQRVKVYDLPTELGLSGLSSGFNCIDKITGGWQNTNLIILAARPGMGKTAFALNLARNAALECDKPTLIFSLEMSKEQLVDRMVAAETEIYLNKITNRQLTDFDKKRIITTHDLINSSIYIDDSGSLTIQSLRAKAIRLKHKVDIGLIVVDYLQLLSGDKNAKGTREQEISAISRGLKALAKELDIPVIALSQLSRNSESRPGVNGKRPMLSDLRESGSIEQDADQVVFLFRPEYYGITEDDNGRALIGLTEIIFAKNRSGALDTAELSFNGALMKFTDL